jgi:hypothetical protein
LFLYLHLGRLGITGVTASSCFSTINTPSAASTGDVMAHITAINQVLRIAASPVK